MKRIEKSIKRVLGIEIPERTDLTVAERCDLNNYYSDLYKGLYDASGGEFKDKVSFSPDGKLLFKARNNGSYYARMYKELYDAAIGGDRDKYRIFDGKNDEDLIHDLMIELIKEGKLDEEKDELKKYVRYKYRMHRYRAVKNERTNRMHIERMMDLKSKRKELNGFEEDE